MKHIITVIIYWGISRLQFRKMEKRNLIKKKTEWMGLNLFIVMDVRMSARGKFEYESKVLIIGEWRISESEAWGESKENLLNRANKSMSQKRRDERAGNGEELG